MIGMNPEKTGSTSENFMKIDAINTKITNLLKDSYYCIPRFQRKFVWTEKEVCEFLKDVNENAINYFIGSVVLYNYQKEDNERKDVKGIVDGQQRLTTILLILMAIKDIFTSIAEKTANENLKEKLSSSSRGTYKNYIKRKDDDSNVRHVVISETSKNFLEKIFDESSTIENISKEDKEALTEEENTLLSAYVNAKMYFEKLIKDYSEEEQYKILYDFREKILQLSVITVSLVDLDSAHIVFDSLNDRGKSIDAVDKTKSYLMRLLKKPSLDTDSPLHRWNKIQEKLNADRESNIFIDYMEAYVKSIIPKEISKDKLFDEIKTSIISKSTTNAESFLKNLEKNVDYFLSTYNQRRFYNVFNVSDDNAKCIKKSLEALKLYNIKVHTSFLILAIREFKSQNISSKNLSTFLEKAVSFHFKYNAIHSYPGNTLRKHYRNLVKNLLEVNQNKNNKIRTYNFDEIPYDISNIELYNGKFKEKIRFSERENSNKKIVQHVLEKVDKYFLTNSVEYEYGSMTIEHLIPQSENNAAIAQIGNLIYVTRDMQDKLKDKNLKEKIKILEDNGYFNNYNHRLLLPKFDDISALLDDQIKIIEDRTQKIVDLSFQKIWK